MNLGELKNTVMFQTNNDADDLGDFLPYLTDYINEGYDRLVYAFCGEHVSQDSDGYPPLKNDKTAPELPEWAHHAIADWATWMVYRNGSAPKQSRGLRFREAFEQAESRLQGLTDVEKGLVNENGHSTRTGYGRFFRNLPW